MSQISLTFPDGAKRAVPAGTSRAATSPSRSRRRSPSEAVAVQLDGKLARPRRAHQGRRRIRIPHARRSRSARADPPRRGACDGRGRAGALSRHASHHRSGHRERLLLRLRARRALHARRSAQDRSQDARDRRPRRALHLRGDGPQGGEEAVPRQGRDLQARADRRHPRRRGDQDLLASANGSISAAGRI